MHLHTNPQLNAVGPYKNIHKLKISLYSDRNSLGLRIYEAFVSWQTYFGHKKAKILLSRHRNESSEPLNII